MAFKIEERGGNVLVAQPEVDNSVFVIHFALAGKIYCVLAPLAGSSISKELGQYLDLLHRSEISFCLLTDEKEQLLPWLEAITAQKQVQL